MFTNKMSMIVLGLRKEGELREYDECWKTLVKSTGITAPALECCSVIGWQEQELLIGHKNGKREPHRSRCDSTPITNTFTPAATQNSHFHFRAEWYEQNHNFYITI